MRRKTPSVGSTFAHVPVQSTRGHPPRATSPDPAPYANRYFRFYVQEFVVPFPSVWGKMWCIGFADMLWDYVLTSAGVRACFGVYQLLEAETLRRSQYSSVSNPRGLKRGVRGGMMQGCIHIFHRCGSVHETPSKKQLPRAETVCLLRYFRPSPKGIFCPCLVSPPLRSGQQYSVSDG